MKNIKLDILAFGAHPDDVELGCGGTILKEISNGKKVGIIDLTRGELGTRGSADIRDSESNNASKILGISLRENLNFKDGFFVNDDKRPSLKTRWVMLVKFLKSPGTTPAIKSS